MKYVVYQHKNPNTGTIFYIGSGKAGSEAEVSVLYRRKKLYKLYCMNNKLISDSVNHNVIVEVLGEYSDNYEAIIAEHKLLATNYGLPGYQLINAQIEYDNAFGSYEALEKKFKKLREVRCIPVVNISTGIQYPSISAMAEACNIDRTTLQRRLNRRNGKLFSDGINPKHL